MNFRLILVLYLLSSYCAIASQENFKYFLTELKVMSDKNNGDFSPLTAQLCKKAKYFSNVKTIRSNSGKYCKSPIGAAVAFMICDGVLDFNQSGCASEAKKLQIASFETAKATLEKLNLNGNVTEKSICDIINQALGNDNLSCRNVIKSVEGRKKQKEIAENEAEKKKLDDFNEDQNRNRFLLKLAEERYVSNLENLKKLPIDIKTAQNNIDTVKQNTKDLDFLFSPALDALKNASIATTQMTPLLDNAKAEILRAKSTKTLTKENLSTVDELIKLASEKLLAATKFIDSSKEALKKATGDLPKAQALQQLPKGSTKESIGKELKLRFSRIKSNLRTFDDDMEPGHWDYEMTKIYKEWFPKDSEQAAEAKLKKVLSILELPDLTNFKKMEEYYSKTFMNP